MNVKYFMALIFIFIIKICGITYAEANILTSAKVQKSKPAIIKTKPVIISKEENFKGDEITNSSDDTKLVEPNVTQMGRPEGEKYIYKKTQKTESEWNVGNYQKKNRQKAINMSIGGGVGYHSREKGMEYGLGVSIFSLKDSTPIYGTLKGTYFISSDKDGDDGYGVTGEQNRKTVVLQAQIGLRKNNIGILYGYRSMDFSLYGYSAYDWWKDYNSPIAWNGNYADYRAYNQWSKQYNVKMNEIGLSYFFKNRRMVTISYSKPNEDHPVFYGLNYKQFMSDSKEYVEFEMCDYNKFTTLTLSINFYK